jgi:8-oxo-dGTP diphosphatase
MKDLNVCAAVIYNGEGEVLLQLRDNKPNLRSPGYWTLPGGQQENTESQIECIVREIYEETNLILKNPVYFMTLKDIYESAPFPLVHFYLNHIKLPYNIICNEGQELKFWDVNSISDLKVNKYLNLVLCYAKLFDSNRENLTG